MNLMPADIQKLRRSLIAHEGYRKFPYIDTVGKVSIGIGYNLTDLGIDDEWINDRYEKDVTYFYNKLSTFPWFNDLNTDRKIVLIDMSFMGWKHFMEFHWLHAALARHDYKDASDEMLKSKWAEQTKSRAIQLAHAMLTGVYEI